ncbi:MAG: hypothetical protein JW795_09095 [Chitinivibrionales bacterium]|nr:hypothetical protein [Chitinivibrionales bacterium]
MHLRIICIALLSLAVLESSATGIFLGGKASLFSYNRVRENGISDSLKTTYSPLQLDFQPFLGLMLSEKMELNGRLAYQLTTQKQVSGSGSNESEYTSVQQAFGFCGAIYFHTLRSEFAHLSIGPDAIYLLYLQPSDKEDGKELPKYDEFKEAEFTLSIPVNADIYLAKNMALRFSVELLSIGLYSWETRFLTTKYKTNTFRFYMLENINPALGIFLMF